jgi:hypothetical protein
MVRPDRPAKVTPVVAPPPLTGLDVNELREENRRLQAKVEKLEAMLKEMTVPVAVAAEPPAPEPPAQAAQGQPAQSAQGQSASSQRLSGKGRADQPDEENGPRTIIHIHRHESCQACATAQRKIEELQKQVDQSQREAKEIAAQRQAAAARAEAAEKQREDLAESLKGAQQVRDELAQSLKAARQQRDELAESLKTARQERDVAVIDAEAAAKARDEALRTVDYSKKERDEAQKAAEAAAKRASDAVKDRDAAVNAAQQAAKKAVDQAAQERDDARAAADAATQDRDTARRISQELQRQRLAAYDEAKAARAEVAPARLALAVSERVAEERRVLAEQYRSGEGQWAQFAVQVAAAVGITDLLPPQEERWTSRQTATQAWLAKVQKRHAVALPQSTRASSEGDRTGANFSYIEGLRQLRQQNYAAAVGSFSEAIDRYPNDARYFYLRGMARHLANRGRDLAEAEQDARRAAALEKQNSPAPRVVDQALERFQGSSRLWTEQFRR